MPSCLECFSKNDLKGVELQILVDREHPDFVCEATKCSELSDGPVEDAEELAFLLVDPASYDPVTKIVTPDAFRELTNRDLSVLRVGIAHRVEAEETRDRLIVRGKEKNPPEIRLVDEVCVAAVSEVRSQTIEGQRVLGVYDTALDGQPAHASIFTTQQVHSANKLGRKRVRALCYEVFSKRIISYSDFAATLAI